MKRLVPWRALGRPPPVDEEAEETAVGPDDASVDSDLLSRGSKHSSDDPEHARRFPVVGAIWEWGAEQVRRRQAVSALLTSIRTGDTNGVSGAVCQSWVESVDYQTHMTKCLAGLNHMKLVCRFWMLCVLMSGFWLSLEGVQMATRCVVCMWELIGHAAISQSIQAPRIRQLLLLCNRPLVAHGCQCCLSMALFMPKCRCGICLLSLGMLHSSRCVLEVIELKHCGIVLAHMVASHSYPRGLHGLL